MPKNKESIREAYGKALLDIGRDLADVVVLDSDVSQSTRSVYFAETFPDRFFNFGIAEANMMSAAAGLACCGKIPFANTFSFLAALRSADPVRSLIAYNNLNVKIGGAYSGLSDSRDGASHQSICDIAVMRALPNMTIVSPADAVETRMAVAAAARHIGPVFLRLSRAEIPVVFDSTHTFEIGKGNLLKAGADVTLVCTGYMVQKALLAAQCLRNERIDAEVIEIHTIKPIDKEILASSASKTGAIVTVEEHNILGGLGEAVAAVAANCCPCPIEYIGIKDTFAESGGYEELLDKYGLSVKEIVNAAKAVIQKKR